MSELRLKFHYEHGTADAGRLDLYDASVALSGIARATSMVTHAYLNGEVRTRGEAAHGAKFYINTPKRGSFIYEAVIFVGGAVSSGVFYDFIKYAFNEAVGKLDQNEDQYKALAERIEPTIGELPAVLESPLEEVHRPIRKEHEITLTVMRPRGEKLVVFDSESALYLLPKTVEATHPIFGNVTKYNALTGWGRFFDLIEGRTISFNIDLKSSERQRSLITWSLHENNMKREGTLYLKAEAVVTPTGKIKRYNVKTVDDKKII
ncbi:MAG: hypothetical protein Q8J70_09975 [Thiobacillus sp.]|nr:hypothetical protein [Thiobacillus sp.]